MSNVCKHQCPIASGVCNPNECEIIKNTNSELLSAFNEALDDWISDLESEDIYILPELLEKMKDFKERIESQVFS